MKVVRRELLTLEKAYSIVLLPGKRTGQWPGFVAGSEGDGPLIHFAGPDAAPRVLADGQGGYISLCPCVMGSRRWVIVSCDFKPGFEARHCRLLAVPIDDAGAAEPRELAPLPYTHRLGLLTDNGRTGLVASTLCSGKKCRDDWSRPGGIYWGPLPDDLNDGWTPRPVVEGLRKNHGMEAAWLDRGAGRGFLLSSMEGLFHARVPADPARPWPVERLAEGEYSDAWAFHWPGRGTADVFSLSPFHGNVLSVHRVSEKGWERRVVRDDLQFAHTVWTGMLLGQPALIAGSRRGRCELRLFRAATDDGTHFAEETIDEGVGAAQLVVVDAGPPVARLLVTARDRGAVVLYELSA